MSVPPIPSEITLKKRFFRGGWRMECSHCSAKPSYMKNVELVSTYNRHEDVVRSAITHSLWFHCPRTWLGSKVTNPETAKAITNMLITQFPGNWILWWVGPR